MPDFGNTPEKLLGRHDSKNPATTCKGITSNGRPCRRALPASTASRRDSEALNGVVALVKEDGQLQEADFYCWQHKDQAEQRVDAGIQKGKNGRTEERSTELFALQERSSIDTMVQRLGLDAENDNKAKKTTNPRPPRKTQTNDFAGQTPSQAPHAQKYGLGTNASRPSKPKARGLWSTLCCMIGAEDDDYVEIVRHRKRASQAAQKRPEMTASRPASVPGRQPVASSPSQPTPQHRRSSNAQTNNLLSLIPQSLSPQTTSTLLAELVKPISPADEEGYIYIFWLTPQSNAQPPESTARFLLTPPSARSQLERRISDVMTEFSFDGSEESAPRGSPHSGNKSGNVKKTIMLKIGRANNITRRMNEWSRQCGYAMNLVRWYPHAPSSSATNTPTHSPAASPSARRQSQQQPLYPDLSRPPSGTASRRQSDIVRKVPFVKRVERLIHLELQEQRVMKRCGACGKEHREWFEVEASTRGVKAVDETVRRWAGWAEREAGMGI